MRFKSLHTQCFLVLVILPLVFISGTNAVAASLASHNAILAGRFANPGSTISSMGKLDFPYSSPNIGEPESTGRPLIHRQLYHDITFLLHEPEFYAVVGGLGVAPFILDPAFKGESPEFSEQWGPSHFADGFFELGEGMGQAVYPVSASIATWGIGGIVKSRSLCEFGSDLFRAQAVNGLLTLAMKGVVRRVRPNGGPFSYPSGHTSTAFASAGVIYRHFGKTLGIPALALATYVGLSRLQENKHYLSDVIAGGILGSSVSLKIQRRENPERAVSFRPVATNGLTGLAVAFRF
jgi:hypothetical protein